MVMLLNVARHICETVVQKSLSFRRAISAQRSERYCYDIAAPLEFRRVLNSGRAFFSSWNSSVVVHGLRLLNLRIRYSIKQKALSDNNVYTQ